MKLAINKTGGAGRIVTEAYAETIKETHRVVAVEFTGSNEYGQYYTDVWGGTWRLNIDGTTLCTVGVMGKWS